VVTASCAALLECQQLLGAECLVVDLRCRLNQVLEVGSGEEISEVYEFTVVLILDVDNSPSVLTSSNLLACNDNRLLGSNNGERDNILERLVRCYCCK
jgi:hypothetical protein